MGALPNGTPVIVSGIDDGTVRVWRLDDDGRLVGEPLTLTGHTGQVTAVSVSALPDGSPVIVSGGYGDHTLGVWQLPGGIELGPPLELTGPVRAIATGGGVIVTAAGGDISVHRPVFLRQGVGCPPTRKCNQGTPPDNGPGNYPVHQPGGQMEAPRLRAAIAWTPDARLGHVIRCIGRGSW
jgi:WD40 repeat protein